MTWIGALAAVAASAAEPTIEELLVATDDASRGTSSQAILRMDVKTAHYERSMKMQVWSKGAEKTLVKILEPAKDAGVSTLKVDENLWNYLPKVDRTMKIPAGMMSGSWMGSHFSNDDLVREDRLSDDFTCSFTAKPDTDPEKNYVVTCVPKPTAAVVWGKVVAHIRPDKAPVRVEYVDEKGTLVRTMSYGDYKTMNGRPQPLSMRLTPHDKPGESTSITFESLELDVDLPDSVFTLQALKP
jgi:outer membrane lipoprotein-sorting protein